MVSIDQPGLKQYDRLDLRPHPPSPADHRRTNLLDVPFARKKTTMRDFPMVVIHGYKDFRRFGSRGVDIMPDLQVYREPAEMSMSDNMNCTQKGFYYLFN